MFFGLGTWELLLIGVAALLVVGPEGLPKLFATIARLLTELRRVADDVRHQVEQQLEDVGHAPPPPVKPPLLGHEPTLTNTDTTADDTIASTENGNHSSH